MDTLYHLTRKIIRHNSQDPKRIQHLLKVHGLAKLICQGEGVDPKTQYILETAALIHDIGIRPSEEIYGFSTGKLQEEEGPKHGEAMLKSLGYDQEVIDRVCYLIGHHHTYSNVDGIDYRILIEADFLVNLYEGEESEEAARKAYDNIFVTKTGKELFKDMYF